MSLDTALDKLLEEPTAVEPKYRPRTEFDGTTGYIQTGPLPEAPKDHDALLRYFEYNPDEVCIDGGVGVSRWQQRARNKDTGEFETVWLAAYRFRIIARPAKGPDFDDLLERITTREPAAPVRTGPYVFNFQASDLQISKTDGGGTDAIVAKFLESVDLAVEELRSVDYLGILGVHIMFPGDCIEGNQSQDGRNFWRTEHGITAQTRIFRRLLMYVIERFAPLTARVWVSVVNGNHDQAQRFQNTYPGDGWATECAIGVSDMLKLNPAAYGHVIIEVPDPEQGYMTVERGDTIFTIAHGHQWAGGGSSKQSHAFTWWADQAFNGQNPGGAHVLAHGHRHTWAVETNKSRTRICSPTFDGGSNHYREKTGAEARRGGLVYLTRAGEVFRMSLV